MKPLSRVTRRKYLPRNCTHCNGHVTTFKRTYAVALPSAQRDTSAVAAAYTEALDAFIGPCKGAFTPPRLLCSFYALLDALGLTPTVSTIFTYNLPSDTLLAGPL